MKKITLILVLLIGTLSNLKAQNPIFDPQYQQGFKAGVEVGEYYRGEVLANHPEYSISYDIKYYQVDPSKPGGLNAASGTYNYTQGFVQVYFVTADPDSQIRNLYSDSTIIAQGDYLYNQFLADQTNMYNRGIWQGFNARMSGKVGGLQ